MYDWLLVHLNFIKSFIFYWQLNTRVLGYMGEHTNVACSSSFKLILYFTMLNAFMFVYYQTNNKS